MKTFFKLLPSLIIPMLLVFTFVITYQGLEKKDVIISKIEKATKDVDHTQFEILHQEFETPQKMTEACLSCHNKRGKEFMQTAHWKWTSPDTLKGGTVLHIGKKNVINNFCIGINTNERLCSSCHAGFGWEDKSFDFTDQNNVDCIVCHDNTGTYKKTKAGGISSKVNLNKVAQNVGPTKSKNCIKCHAKGGGGNNVKHGDLDMDMTDPDICTKEIDVHMAKDGANLTCSQCHITSQHDIKGEVPLSNSNTLSHAENRATCIECHTDKPHDKAILNDHYNKVACQTCHIPEYAKINKTQIDWDWSTAGLRDGEKFKDVAEDGMKKSDSGHGTAVYGKNLRPEYKWWNGIAGYTTLDTKIDPTGIVEINPLQGGYDDINSRIYPMKIMRGKQPYDTKNNTFVQLNTFGKKGTGAFWKNFDWQKGIRTGMEYAEKPYSGHYDFVSTQSYWPLNHMVSESNKSLTCIECHSRDGVLADLDNFYLPGRDVNIWLDWAGKLFILFSILGVLIHTVLRIKAKRKNYS